MDVSLDLFRIGFLTITVIDLVDVAIVAIVLFRLHAMMRGTIAAQIFVGLVLILAVSFISQTLNMKLLSWILRTVSDIWVIALIVLFQPELRRILLLVGRQGVFATVERFDISKLVDELLEATEELSLRRFGALVVLTRTTDISLTVDTGVPVDARLSKEMLVSIFNPKSPLHDGAVIVTGEQLRYARVILPLSPVMLSADIRLGTRHRAGLGISEQADVFVIIVSEESGNISYAVDGDLFYNQSLDSLRLALIKSLEAVASRKERSALRSQRGRRGPGEKPGGVSEVKRSRKVSGV